MSAVLGISAFYHDSAAALVIDGEIVAAMQEERFSRRKFDATLPSQAARACLAQAKLAPDDVDRVVFYEDPFARLERVLLSLLRTFPRSWRQFPKAVGAQVGSKILVLDRIAKTIGVSRQKVTTVTHHRSHAASAFFASTFDKAAVLTVDGMGEDISTAIWLGSDRSLSCIGAIEYPHSIGLLYAAITAYLGFEVNDGEYKVMGLAAFGEPKFKDEFSKLLRLRTDGSFELDMSFFAFHTDTDILFSHKLEMLLGTPRSRSKSWDLQSNADDRRCADIAASLQWITEEALVSLAKEAQRRTGCKCLCLAGGVALNCVANARILKECGFDRVFVQPAAGDAGGALGAAILGSIELDGTRPQPMTTAALGTSISNDATRALAERLGIKHSIPEDILGCTANLIAQNKIVGVARGRFEWGPRALGNRSILAAPQDVAMREKMNRAIKKREPFRPFAPAVIKQEAGIWFTDHDNDMTPFMTTIGRVQTDHASELQAVTHVDGTARVQTVDQLHSPDLYELLSEVGRRTGAPIVLNTSLNGNGEPIVASEVDALGFFISHSIDAMVAGDVLLQRHPS